MKKVQDIVVPPWPHDGLSSQASSVCAVPYLVHCTANVDCGDVNEH